MRIKIQPSRAISALAMLTIVAIMVSVAFLLWDLRRRELDDTRSETASLTRMLMEQTEQAFDGIDLALRGIQERFETPYGNQVELDSLAVHLLLSARVLGMRQVNSFFIVDPDGFVVNSSRQYPRPPVSARDRDYYKAFADGTTTGLFVGNPERSRFNGAWTLHLARRLSGADGSFRGVAVTAVNLDHFEQIYNHMSLEVVRPIALYLDNGRLVASLPHREGDIGEIGGELHGAQISAPEDDVRLITHVSGDGTKQIVSLGGVPGFPFLVSVTDDEVEALASWRETAAPIALGAGFVSILVGIAAVFLSLRLQREEALARALRDADDRYLRTIDSVMDAIISVDESQRITMFNPAAERMFGIPASAAVGSPLTMLMPERLREAHARHIEGFVRSGVGSRAMAPHMEITGVRADGSEFPIESTISQTVIDGRQQLTAVLRDITERRRAEFALREMNRELRRLSASLQSIREDERGRISRELHDELGQQLTGLKLELSWLSSRLKEGREAAPGQVDSMREQLDGAIAAVRRISAELRPRILDELGFGEAVTWQAGEFEKRSGIEVTLNLRAAAQVKGDMLATALFRIVQESLTNVARHAAASRVDISLVAEHDSLVLRIADNGRGVDAGVQGGIGLVSMRERATALGGHFDVVSHPGDGTVIEVRVPCHAVAAEEDA